MSEILALLRRHDVEQADHKLTTGREFVAADRYEGVADATQVVDLFVGMPSGADYRALVSVRFSTGGLAHLDTTDGASVDTAGTALPYQSKGVENTMQTTVEAGGTYSSTGEALHTVQPGTSRDGGPATTQGADAASDVRLLSPGDGVEYVLTNQSGGASDFSVSVEVIELG